MNTLELKNYLIYKIASINDKCFLSALKTILESKVETEKETSKQQKEKISYGKTQIKNGDFITNEELEIYVKEWMKEK